MPTEDNPLLRKKGPKGEGPTEERLGGHQPRISAYRLTPPGNQEGRENRAAGLEQLNKRNIPSGKSWVGFRTGGKKEEAGGGTGGGKRGIPERGHLPASAGGKKRPFYSRLTEFPENEKIAAGAAARSNR